MTSSFLSERKTEKILQLTTSNVRTFVFSAVMLAENLRGMLLYLNNKKIKIPRLPGPSTVSIVTELWKYIQCQELNSDIPLGFEKVMQTGINRLDHLLKTVESQRG